ncbi:MAG: CoA transferase [Polyangiales bacterium]
MLTTPRDRSLLAQLWQDLDGPSGALDAVELRGPEHTLPSVYEVSALASASVAAATLAAAELAAARSGGAIPQVTIEREHAATAFACERHLHAINWELPAGWDSLAGDYACRDGFIRLHTNYAHHRAAVTQVLGTKQDRGVVRDAVLGWDGDVLENAVVAAGGCAAFMRSPAAWRQHPQGQALAAEPLFTREHWRCEPLDLESAATAGSPESAGPLAGVRVLDLTRVIAGPVATRFLAAWGADVLRIDPPGFEEVGALLAEVTVGKRRASLDLHEPADRQQFEALMTGAHVIVHGYRSDALAKLGYGSAQLRALNPNAAQITHAAYGFAGPWATRRGFDSLVQMSSGIAWRGREVLESDKPQPLPVQALDHATGYLLAAAACRALTVRSQQQQASRYATSLARVATCLTSLGDQGDIRAPALAHAQIAPWLEQAETTFGQVQRVRPVGHMAGHTPRWPHPAGPLGSDAAAW